MNHAQTTLGYTCITPVSSLGGSRFGRCFHSLTIAIYTQQQLHPVRIRHGRGQLWSWHESRSSCRGYSGSQRILPTRRGLWPRRPDLRINDSQIRSCRRSNSDDSMIQIWWIPGCFKNRSGLGNTRGRAREVYFERNLSRTGDRRISQYHKYGLQKVSGFLDTSRFLGHSCFKERQPYIYADPASQGERSGTHTYFKNILKLYCIKLKTQSLLEKSLGVNS